MVRRRDPGNRFYFEHPSDSENTVCAYVNQRNELTISVAEEQPVDSYNETFECSIHLPIEHARRLRDYLNNNL